MQNVLVSSNTQASPALSDVFSRLGCELNEFQSTNQIPKARTAALATAEQDTDAAKGLILSMPTRRNMLVPISILPEEVLSRIFRFIAFEELPYSLGCVHLRVTHVCRRWRQVALDDSTLWTPFLDLPRNKDWITKRLSRARNAPLVLELDKSMGKDTLSLFTPHISHTRELFLRNLSFHPEIVQEISIQKAPILECLELEALDSLQMDNEHVGHLFFKGTLPNLRILRISQSVFPWSLFPRGQLTQLEVILIEEVSAVPSLGSQHDDLNQLIGLLVASPSLEVLTLHNCLPTMLSESSARQTINLPRLSRLCLRGSSSRVTNLFKMLKLPSSTSLRLNCTSENTATHNDYHILPILSEHFSDPTPVKFRSFKLNLDHAHHVIDMIASTSLPMSPIRHATLIRADGDPELWLSFRRVDDLDGADILRRACNVLCLAHLEFLSMWSNSPNQFINWSEVFQHCTEVTMVDVYGCGTIGLLQALTPPKRADTTAREDSDNGRGAQGQTPNDNDSYAPARGYVPIFPKLTSLRLKSLDFNKNVVPGSGVLFNLVLNAVQRRKVNKTPLTTLCIEHCVIRGKQAKVLEKLVCGFRWDYLGG